MPTQVDLYSTLLPYSPISCTFTVVEVTLDRPIKNAVFQDVDYYCMYI